MQNFVDIYEKVYDIDGLKHELTEEVESLISSHNKTSTSLL